MLRKAQERVREHKLKHVEALAVMDGTRLGFPDGAFDAVLAQYVITTVPDPEGTLDEFARVTRPGGEIILVNHLGAESGLRRDFERSFAPMARKLGWQPEFSWARLEQWAARNGGVRVIERRPMPPLGHFSLIRFERLVTATSAANGGCARAVGVAGGLRLTPRTGGFYIAALALTAVNSLYFRSRSRPGSSCGGVAQLVRAAES